VLFEKSDFDARFMESVYQNTAFEATLFINPHRYQQRHRAIFILCLRSPDTSALLSLQAIAVAPVEKRMHLPFEMQCFNQKQRVAKYRKHPRTLEHLQPNNFKRRG